MALGDDAWTFYRDALPIMLVSLAGSFIAGIVLGGPSMRASIGAIPGLLIVIPAFMALRGNVYGALGARISTALHQGLIQPRFEYNEKLLAAMTAAVINGITMSCFLGLAGWGIATMMGQEVSLIRFTAIMLISGSMSAVAMSITLTGMLFAGYRHGIDPDILNGPLITSLGDVLGISLLMIAIQITAVIL